MLLIKYAAHLRLLLVTVSAMCLICYVCRRLDDPVVYVIFGLTEVLMGIDAITLMVGMFSGRFSIQTSRVRILR